MKCLEFTRTTQVILFFVFVIITRTVSQVCDYENSVELINRSYNGIEYKDGEYFVDNETGIERGCVCMKEICARKCCPFGQGFRENDSICIYMSKDGRLYFTKKDNNPLHFVYAPDRYCIDNFIDGTGTIKLNALICAVVTPEVDHHYRYTINAVCMLISCFFIVLTVAVYAILPDLRNTVHGMVMISYLLCFFVGFVIMATLKLVLLNKFIHPDWCTGLSLVVYFSFLAAFFWLNVICFDLWWKLRTVNVSTHGFTSAQRTRFLKYNAYAFGIPILLTVLLIANEFSNVLESIVPRAKLREQGSCFLTGMAKMVYFYAPIFVLCVLNIIFFALVIVRITTIKKQTQRLQKKDTQRFALYIKLFIVTGINWFLEVLGDLYPDIDYLYQFTDAYNVLIGFIIFIIFVCKKKIFIALKHRYKESMGIAHSKSQTTTTSGISMQSRADIPS